MSLEQHLEEHTWVASKRLEKVPISFKRKSLDENVFMIIKNSQSSVSKH